jgi:protein-tyrosine phosphatase
MIDLHCHVLPAIDDGPASVKESLALARAAVRQGTSTLVATPHVSLRYSNTPTRIEQVLADFKARLRVEQIDLELCAGSEIAMARVADLRDIELARLTLGGGRWLLVEPPFASAAHGLEPIMLDLLRRGFRVLLAHPERCAAFHRDPAMLTAMVSNGARTSITAGALVGRFGRTVHRFALALAHEGLVHNVASDAHDPHGRSPSVLAELAQAELAPLAEWLTQEVPAAILAGQELPRRPVVSLAPPGRRSNSRWRWLRRDPVLRRV